MSTHQAAVTASATLGSATRPLRLHSIDVARGVVMVLMALDHVRVYAGIPAGGPDPAIFFTRWVTHFCAPAFVFLAGTSAFLYGTRLRSPGALARYLVTRGLILLVLELTWLRTAWTFNLDVSGYLLAGVIWMLGWCMVLLALLVRLPAAWIGIFGVAMIALHNVIDLSPERRDALMESGGVLGQLLYFGGPISLGDDGPLLAVLYSIVPWIGVMAAGYGLGAILVRPEQEWRRRSLGIGLGMIALFVILRGLDLYGDPNHWRDAAAERMPAVLAFLNTTKYPASLLFLLMTLGPLLALLPALEAATGAAGRALALFGRVPLFYYLLHIPLIHLTAVLIAVVRQGRIEPWLFANHPMMPGPPPDGYPWSLFLLYIVWIAVVAALYPLCRAYADVKARHPQSWLRYL